MRVTVGGESRNGKMIDAMVCNGRFLGGGMMMCPDAEPDDGLFDVLLIGDVTKRDLAFVLPKTYQGQAPPPSPARAPARPRRHGRLGRAAPIELDGEQPGTTPVRFEIVPRALRLRVPARTSPRASAATRDGQAPSPSSAPRPPSPASRPSPRAHRSRAPSSRARRPACAGRSLPRPPSGHPEGPREALERILAGVREPLEEVLLDRSFRLLRRLWHAAVIPGIAIACLSSSRSGRANRPRRARPRASPPRRRRA